MTRPEPTEPTFPLFMKVPWLWAHAICFGPLCLWKGEKLSATTKNHERIHWPQWVETLFVGFLIIYVADWLHAARITGDWRIFGEAYRSIRFEQEAFTYEGDPRYLQHRKRFAWRAFTIPSELPSH